MTKPIKPHEVAAAKVVAIPDVVFEAFNELIVERMDDGTAKVLQRDVVYRIVKKIECTPDEIFEKGWLNVEAAYRKAGWSVEYDKPGYNEDYDAFFRFTPRRTRREL